MKKMTSRKIGEILVEIANLKNEDLQKALVDQEEINQRIGEILVSRDLITEDQLYRALGIQFELPWIEEIVFNLVKKSPTLNISLGGVINKNFHYSFISYLYYKATIIFRKGIKCIN